MVAIVFSGGPLAGQRLELERELTVGRSDCDVTLDDPEVSRRHLVLRPVGADLHVEDLGSTNGTLVNGHRIADTVSVVDGSVIRVGASELIVEITTPAQAPAATMPKAVVPTPATLAGAPVATVPAAVGGLPGWFWIATELLSVAVILIGLVVLVYYAF